MAQPLTSATKTWQKQRLAPGARPAFLQQSMLSSLASAGVLLAAFSGCLDALQPLYSTCKCFVHLFAAQSNFAGGNECKLCWCSLFFVIMGNNLHHLLASSFGRSPAFYTLIAAAAMIPTVWLPDLKALSYLGFAGVSATAAVTLTVRTSAPKAGCRNSLHIPHVPQTARV